MKAKNLIDQVFDNLIVQNQVPHMPGRHRRCKIMRTKGCPDEIYFNGIDRLYNTCGYILGNIVTCCSTCNYRKGNMHVDDFLLWIAKIASNRKI